MAIPGLAIPGQPSMPFYAEVLCRSEVTDSGNSQYHLQVLNLLRYFFA
jgi:hypothetical protein